MAEYIKSLRLYPQQTVFERLCTDMRGAGITCESCSYYTVCENARDGFFCAGWKIDTDEVD